MWRTRDNLAIMTGITATVCVEAPSKVAFQLIAQDEPEELRPEMKNLSLSISSSDCITQP